MDMDIDIDIKIKIIKRKRLNNMVCRAKSREQRTGDLRTKN